MAPELIDPDRFGYKFARTKASDIYAFGCVCLEVGVLFPVLVCVSSPSASSYTPVNRHFPNSPKLRLCCE
jgi:hypothetical protein